MLARGWDNPIHEILEDLRVNGIYDSPGQPFASQSWVGLDDGVVNPALAVVNRHLPIEI